MGGTIVCAVADAAGDRAVAQLAAALAERLRLRVVLVQVVREARWPAHDGGGTPGARAAGRSLEELARELGEEFEARVVAGDRVDRLVQVAAEEGADAIVLGSRTRGARGRQLRCTLARELEAATSVPVLIAPPQTRRRSGRRLAPADATRRR